MTCVWKLKGLGAAAAWLLPCGESASDAIAARMRVDGEIADVCRD